jgi:arylsulfatase A-like enzyme
VYLTGYVEHPEQALYEDPWKLIERGNGEVELYDVREDPAEKHDLAAERPEVVAKLRGALAAFNNTVQPRFSADSAAADEEAIERLRALGYLK